MFVTFMESSKILRGAHIHNGCTVTIEEEGEVNMYTVGRYNSNGNWIRWSAHIDELIGFDSRPTTEIVEDAKQLAFEEFEDMSV